MSSEIPRTALVVVSSPSDIKRFQNLIPSWFSDSELLVRWVATTYGARRFLEERGIDCFRPEEYVDAGVRAELERAARKWAVRWAFDSSSDDSRGFLEELSYESTSVMWFIDHKLYVEFFYPVVWEIEWLSRAMDTEKPDYILYPEGSIHKQVIDSLASDIGVQTLTIGPVWREQCVKLWRQLRGKARLLIREHFGLSRPLFRYLLRKIVRVAGLLFNRSDPLDREREASQFDRTVLCLGFLRYPQSMPRQEPAFIRDPYWPPIIEQLTEYRSVTVEKSTGLCDMGGVGAWGRRVVIESCWDLALFCEVTRVARRIKSRWQQLARQLCSTEGACYQDVCYGSALERAVSEFIWDAAAGMAYNVIVMRRLLDRYQPDVVLMHTEAMHHGRAMAYVAEQRGIPTVALQHGIIHPRHRHYFHESCEMPLDLKPADRKCPIAAVTAVYGEFAQNSLIGAGSYPAERVVVTGQPRYDALCEAKESYEKDSICEELGLRADRPIALIIGQPDPAYIRRPFLQAAYTACRNIPRLQLVVKSHPTEDSFGYYQQVADELGVQLDLLVSNRLNELLFVCDLMITIDSTTVIEAVLLEKPVICVNLVRLSPRIPFAHSEAVLGVESADGLREAIYQVLFEPKVGRQLQAGRSSFLAQHIHRADGQAARRVADLVRELTQDCQG